MKKFFVLLIIFFISIPTFWRMIRPGIYSMQDFHFFRLVEYGKCVADGQIPCRWSPDSGLGYGEPLFNFYGQLPYFVGTLFHSIGFPYIDSLKILFVFSLLGSSVSMFFLSKKIWKNNISAIFSSIVYLYAPYRAVDVWVRGALPEALAFVIFPLIILFFENYVDTKNKKYLLLFGFSVASLILTHNLSVILFSPLLLVWIFMRLLAKDKINLVFSLLLMIILALGVSSFYILPVIFESKFINLNSTTQGYFDFRGHFIGIKQILISRYWGYGGSVFGPEDGLNLSVGLFQWFLPAVSILIFIVKKQLLKHKEVIVLVIVGWFYLFLTHNKSIVFWQLFPFLKYIQFPWRFLGVAVFCFALASGSLLKVTKKQKFIILPILSVFVILYSIPFFKEDIWYFTSDNDLTVGKNWEDQSRASIGDYWPISVGPIPIEYAKYKTGKYEVLEKKSNKIVFKTFVDADEIDFPINNFPGWNKKVEGDIVTFEFKNTQIRSVANLISILSFMLGFYLFLKIKANDGKK